MVVRSKLSVFLTAILLLTVAAGAAGDMIILDADRDPVAEFPGNVVINGNLECTTLNGEDCDTLGGLQNDVFVNESGDTMTGNLDMGGNNIDNVGQVGLRNGVIDTNQYGILIRGSGGGISGWFYNNDVYLGSGSGRIGLRGVVDVTGHSVLNVDRLEMSVQGNFLDGSTASFSNIDSGSGGEIDMRDQVNMNGHDIVNCRTINGVDCDSLGGGGSASGLSEVLDQGNKAHGDINMTGYNITSHKEICIGIGCT